MIESAEIARIRLIFVVESDRQQIPCYGWVKQVWPDLLYGTSEVRSSKPYYRWMVIR